MPSRKIQDCDTRLQEVWNKAYELYTITYPDAPKVFLTCTYRSPAEQLDLYAQGRTKQGAIVTNIKSGGKHNVLPSKAFDIAFKWTDGKLDWSEVHFKNFAAIVKRLNTKVQWGGDWKNFKDLPHFQV
jgi:peptidoglycan L-alanyl-D-glutamate endopeptidase CwlK